MKRVLIVTALLACGMTGALAQNPTVLEQRAPNMPAPKDVPAEKVETKDPAATGSTGSSRTLSDKLEQSGGVIRPPATGDGEIAVPAPVPNPGTTPVIPPPGSPGGNQSIQPK